MSSDYLTSISESLEALSDDDNNAYFEVGIGTDGKNYLFCGDDYLGPIRGWEGHYIADILNDLPKLIAEVKALRAAPEGGTR